RWSWNSTNTPRSSRIDYLLHSLKYDFPRACQEKVAGLPRRFRRCLDLGCGTGLCGRALREGPAGEALEWLEGCDLSARMLEKARNAGGYDALHKRDLLGHLQRQPGASFDLLVAGDVFIYVLSLRPVLREARRVLEPGGALVFSTEAAAEDEEAQDRSAPGPFGLRRRGTGAPSFDTAAPDYAQCRDAE
ncbi:unnamed protein product, partial [Prorocentrum cordatum]